MVIRCRPLRLKVRSPGSISPRARSRPALNLLFAPDAAVPLTDGTLNIPAALAALRPNTPALNALDGWSTTAGVDTSFTLPIDAASISASSIKIVKVYLNPSLQVPANPADPAQAAAYLPTGATSPVGGVLTYGVDFTAEVASEPDSYGKFLRITPLKPLESSKGPAVTGGKILNIGYIVLLTNALKAADGQAYGPDTFYAAIKAAPADCSSFTSTAQKQVCQITKANLNVAAAASSTSADSVVLSWHFSTQSIDDTLDVISQTATPKQTVIVPAFNTQLGRILTTKDFSAALPGKANIYLGSTQLPYYLTAATTTTGAAASAAVLASVWQAAGPPPAPFTNTASRNLTMFNPAPAATSTVTVPLLVTVPNATSACGGVRPAGGWPVAIVQHGITGDRSQAIAMADSLADACVIVAAIDLPLHGVVDTTSPLYCTLGPAAVHRRDGAYVQRRPGPEQRHDHRRPRRQDRRVRHALHQPGEPAHQPRQPAPGRSRPDPADEVVARPRSCAGRAGFAAGRPGGRQFDAHQLHRPFARRDRRWIALALRR